MSEYKKECPEILTVIIRDDSPFVHVGDAQAYRSVRVPLTKEQRQALSLNGSWDCGYILYESISRVIIEDVGEIVEKI